MKKIHELTTTLFPIADGAVRMTPSIKQDFFDIAQQQFLDKHCYVVRKHPKKYVFEVYIDTDNLKPSDWTIIHLLFNRRLLPSVKTIY